MSNRGGCLLSSIGQFMEPHRLNLNPGQLAWYEWGERGHPQSPYTLLMLHATGFHAQCWRQVIAALPPDQHIICADLRGHGESSKERHSDWSAFGEDILALVEHLDLHEIVGVGHSMGGYATLTVVSMGPERFRGAILLDPVIVDPALYEDPSMYGNDPREHPAARRRNHWRDWQEMYESFRPRHPFSLWDEQVLRDYCEFGVRPGDTDKDGYELACPPIVEASIYVNSASKSPYHLLDTITIPTWVVRALERDWAAMRASGRFDFAGSPTWSELAKRLPNGKDFYWSDLTHFMPMQAPERVARLIREFMSDL